MIHGDDTGRAVSALMMVIAGLAEGIIDHVANTQPDTLDGRVSRLRVIGVFGDRHCGCGQCRCDYTRKIARLSIVTGLASLSERWCQPHAGRDPRVAPLARCRRGLCRCGDPAASETTS
jgi:hypothetical protein